MTERVFATTRQVTGAGYRHHAYVYRGNRVAVACSHNHRREHTARACAERMLRKYQKEARS